MSKKEKTLRIVIDIVIILIAGIFLVFGIKDLIGKIESTRIPDNVLFTKNYRNVPEDNIYRYIEEKEYEKFLKDGTGVIFEGNPNDPWSQIIAPPLEEVIKELTIDEISYFESEKDTPRVVIVEQGKILAELAHEDLIDSRYDGIPLEYFKDEKHMEELRDLLKVATQLTENRS